VKFKDKTITVTGAAGFLGTHLVEALSRRHAFVIALDKRAFPRNLALDDCDRIKFVSCDILDKRALKEILRETDVVYHLAAIANPRCCGKDFDTAFDINVIGTKNILDASTAAKRFIFTSTAMVYGEPRYLPIDENHPSLGTDSYSITKIIGEKICRNFNVNCGLPTTIVRNFNIYGPRQETSYIIPQLITQGLNENRVELWNPNPVRDFTYCSDAIDALIRVGENEDLAGETLNLGSGIGVKTGEVAEMIGELLQVEVVNLNKPSAGSSIYICNNRKMKAVVDWEPQVDLATGLNNVLEFLKNNVLDRRVPAKK
jgi:dTDP-glucose 4,6-dehydratase